MEKSGSQKFLKVISIIDIVLGILALIAGIMTALLGGAAAAGVVSSGADALATSEFTAEEVGVGIAAFSIIGVFTIVAGIITLLEGILGLRAANDPQKIMPVWVLAIIGLVCSVVSLIMTFVNQGGSSDIISGIANVAGSCLMFWVANNIKVQAGK